MQLFMGLGCECGRFDARYDEICGGVCPWLDGGGATARRASPGATEVTPEALALL